MSFTFIKIVKPWSRELGNNDQPLWIQPYKMTDNCFSYTKPTFWYQVSSINLDTETHYMRRKSMSFIVWK